MRFGNFFKTKQQAHVSFDWLQADMHSHLLPGIDDGSPDMPTSLELIKGFQALGYKKIITTPHILWEVYPNTPEKIIASQDKVKLELKKAGIDIEFRAAAEYFMDEHFFSQLKNKVPLLPISDNMILVEFSMVTAPMDLQDIIFEMQMQNYQPVIAHPERYTYLGRRREVYDQLKDAGCWFQLNLLSLSGYYGEGVHQLAEYLLKKNYYDLAGTDLHHENHLQQLQRLSASQLKKIQDSGMIKNHLL